VLAVIDRADSADAWQSLPETHISNRDKGTLHVFSQT